MTIREDVVNGLCCSECGTKLSQHILDLLLGHIEAFNIGYFKEYIRMVMNAQPKLTQDEAEDLVLASIVMELYNKIPETLKDKIKEIR